jgi:HAD superfamily hydrolase (TIGR01509 family)
MKNSKAIIFDLGAVLLNINYQNTIDEFFKLGVKNASTFYSKKVQTDLFNQIETGKITNQKFLAELQKETTNATIYQVEKAWNAMLLDLPKERISLLKKLKKDYPIFLLSNTNAIHISAIKEYLGENTYANFYNLFNKVYYSHEIGFRKPNKEAFQLILKENNLKANEVVFIDDSPQHIEEAKKLGMKIHHLKDGEEITTLFADRVQ